MENKKIRIYVVEDYMLTRITYRHTLPKNNPNLEIIKDFETAEACINAMQQESADEAAETEDDHGDDVVSL